MDYNQMMRTVAGATGSTRRQADEAVIGTLTVLSEMVSADETRDLLAQLPKSVRDRIPVSGTTLSMRPIEFVARVSELAATASDDTERDVRAVFAVLTEAVNAGEMNDIAAELGPDYAALLGREERLRREAAAEGPGIVESVAAIARRAVRAVGSAAWRPIGAGLRLGGSRD